LINDWGLKTLDAAARHDLLKILGRAADPTYADAIMDRIVHNAQRISPSGHSLRRPRPNKPAKG
jgi:hypothetical protein